MEKNGAGDGSLVVGKVSDLQPGRSKKFRYHGYPAILINYDGKYYAYGAICTHLGCIVHWKDEKGCAMSMGDQIHCVCHAGHFDSRTGNVLGGPPPSPLPCLKVEQRHDEVMITGWENVSYVERLATYKR
jgi:cytochrome b6-f complex iron-sulfur subunit